MSECGGNWEYSEKEMREMRKYWEPILKIENKLEDNTYIVSAPSHSNPPTIAVVTFADGWYFGHFGGRVEYSHTDYGRDYFFVKVFV